MRGCRNSCSGTHRVQSQQSRTGNWVRQAEGTGIKSIPIRSLKRSLNHNDRCRDLLHETKGRTPDTIDLTVRKTREKCYDG
jgi:hypothetical protein